MANTYIKPIDKASVHKICSGQVVLNLAVAVKELVENSLDAGATYIDIRLKNYGIDLIEVSDNGSGVTEDNFAALTQKYYTSKLNDYSDLLGVSSFGFRGEALSSLCLLSNVTIITRHESSQYATKIQYDHHGNIITKTPCSRQVGTTVTLTNLFSSLPVRQKEFHKNSKREFTRMTNLLYAYCLISKGVKITCTHQTSSNSKTVVVATPGSNSYKDNIASVFGHKQLQSILEVKTEITSNIIDNIFKGLSGEVKESTEAVNIDDVEIDLSEDSNDADAKEQNSHEESFSLSQKSNGYKNVPSPVELEGFVSSCEHGCGRSSSDRQFYYINCRPCEPTKIMKLVNEIYKEYNSNQYPFVFLNIKIDRISVDVNVTPDKRQVFLTKEKGILDVIKASLQKLYENIPNTLRANSTLNTNKITTANLNQPTIFNSFIQRFSKKNENAVDKAEPERELRIETIAENKSNFLKRKSSTMLDSFISKKKPIEDSENLTETQTEVNENEIINKSSTHKEYKSFHDFIDAVSSSGKSTADVKITNEILYLESSDNLPETQIRTLSDVIETDSHTIYCKTNTSKQKSSKVALVDKEIVNNEDTQSKDKKIVTDQEEIGKLNKRSILHKTSLEQVKLLSGIYNRNKNIKNPERIKFRSRIDPVFNKKCEEELSKEISKDSFKKMKVIGQFNLGFIITKLEEDLFIIDQHATDEIYNFETLQKTTELTSQKLVIPQQLELTGVNEQILMDNLAIFKKNGFTFEINEDAPPTKRVKLLTLPMSRNWIFGKEDIEELLFMLKDSPSEYCRPSRVRAMFASRACRKSVMIGTALSRADMKQLVDHMGEIDKPWNCPHGRPTIRHLVNLAMIQTNIE